jgi:serine protease Do
MHTGSITIRTMTWLLVAFFSTVAPGCATEPDAGRHIYPLPLTEAEHVVVGWLETGAFRIDRQTPTPQREVLSAEKVHHRWRIMLQHHSALATCIQVEVNPPGAAGDPTLHAFWKHIDKYIQETGRLANESGTSIPKPVRAYRNTVVCIHAVAANGSELQVTGFVVDARGLVVCTGHDLGAGQRVRVQLADGRDLNGQIVRFDAYRDLVLVKVDEPLIAAVPLQDGRDMLHAGDRLFAITWPDGPAAVIEAGYLEGPPRRVAGFPLWQARMHIVHGSSGSPVFDERGHLVAVVKGRFRGTDTIGFLIPFETLMQFLEERGT